MPYPRAAQKRGGQHPASEHQKAVARAWILENKPWLKSTGPKTLVGIAISCGNSRTHGLYRRVIVLSPQQAEVLDQDVGYRAYRKRMAELEAMRERQNAADREKLKVLLRRRFNGSRS
jgi:hypothetical protein